jgi:hypothetical protein
MPVIRGYPEVGSLITIVSDTASGHFALKGRVGLRGGEVFYFQRNFYIREGMLVFNENEITMDPHIALRAEIRDRTEQGPVTIALVIDEAPISSFTPRFESEPPLSLAEILTVLGQNVTGSSSQNAMLVASSDIVTQFSIVRMFEQDVRDALNLDMFSIRTQILQNAMLQASGLVETPVDMTNGLGNYFDNTTVYIGKYFGSDMFVQSMVSLRYDQENPNTLFGGLSIESDIGVELRTPLFTIRWNIVPSHRENLFITDQSFTISWKWSF